MPEDGFFVYVIFLRLERSLDQKIISVWNTLEVLCYVLWYCLNSSFSVIEITSSWLSLHPHSQETMAYHIHHVCLHVIMFQRFPRLIQWKLESLIIIILLCLLYFLMCLLILVHPAVVCNIVLLSALKFLKASCLPFWLRLIHCTLSKSIILD